jgi:hypothetical protein
LVLPLKRPAGHPANGGAGSRRTFLIIISQNNAIFKARLNRGHKKLGETHAKKMEWNLLFPQGQSPTRLDEEDRRNFWEKSRNFESYFGGNVFSWPFFSEENRSGRRPRSAKAVKAASKSGARTAQENRPMWRDTNSRS